jgi:ABC-2 type transport system permease protein
VMVAVGSACNTLKEAQNLLAPVMAVLTLSMLFLVAVAQDPNGTLSRVLSFIPLFTPFLMMLRVAATPPAPPLEIAASIALLALCAYFAMRMAARVFRVGVLMYGKPPSLRELWRWMWTKG